MGLNQSFQFLVCHVDVVESASSIPFSATENDNVDPEISADSTRAFLPGLFCKEFFVGGHIVPAVDAEHVDLRGEIRRLNRF